VGQKNNFLLKILYILEKSTTFVAKLSKYEICTNNIAMGGGDVLHVLYRGD
jgi:hypothetical protein